MSSPSGEIVAGAMSNPPQARNVIGNQRLTAAVAALLLVVLAAEGITILAIGQLLAPHIVIGMLLVPLVVLKLASTGYRFARYYLRDHSYRAKGPPPLVLRATAPVTVLLTIGVLVTGVALLLHGPDSGRLLLLHKATFIGWLAFMGIHVLGHLRELPAAGADWRRHAPAARVTGSSVRILALAVAVAGGVVLGVASLSLAHSWLHFTGGG